MAKGDWLSHDDEPAPAPARPTSERQGRGVWLALRYSLPGFRSPAAVDDATARWASRWLVLWGLVVGLVLAEIYTRSWVVFDHDEQRDMTALLVTLLWMAGVGSAFAVGWATTLDRLVYGLPMVARRAAAVRPAGAIGLVVIGLTLFVTLSYLPAGQSLSYEGWRQHLQWTRPKLHYRVVALAPVWLYYGVVVASGIGPAAARADAVTRGLCRVSSLRRTLLSGAMVGGLTTYWLSEWERPYGVGISLLVFGLLYVTAVLCVRRLGGHSRGSLLASGVLAMLAYLLLAMTVIKPLQYR